MNKYCDKKTWIGELMSQTRYRMRKSKTEFCNGNLIEFWDFFCKQKLQNALFRLDYSFQVCLQSNKFSAAGKRWTSKLKILLWQMPNLMKHTIIQIISEGWFKFLCLQCFDLIHAPKRSNKNFINGRKIRSLDINVTLIHQSMYSSYIITKNLQ